MKDEPKQTKKKYAWSIDESKCLTIDEVIKLRDFSRELKILGLKRRRYSAVRNWFMVELGLEAGLRVSEIASLKHGSLYIDEKRSSIVVIGKGNKKRAVWISSEFKEICLEFIRYKKEFDFSVNDNSFLLNSLKDKKISKRALQKFFKNIVLKSGLPARYHIHCLRHTYATFLLKASKYNYKFVQDQLGHASIKTTQVYAGVIESEGKKALTNLYK